MRPSAEGHKGRETQTAALALQLAHMPVGASALPETMATACRRFLHAGMAPIPACMQSAGAVTSAATRRTAVSRVCSAHVDSTPTSGSAPAISALSACTTPLALPFSLQSLNKSLVQCMQIACVAFVQVITSCMMLDRSICTLPELTTAETCRWRSQWPGTIYFSDACTCRAGAGAQMVCGGAGGYPSGGGGRHQP